MLAAAIHSHANDARDTDHTGEMPGTTVTYQARP